MEAQNSQQEKSPETAPVPAVSSCRKKKNEQATFYEDVKDHIDEFIHASMEDHKNCFKNTMKKMFGMSKAVAEKHAAEVNGVESTLPLTTTVSK